MTVQANKPLTFRNQDGQPIIDPAKLAELGNNLHANGLSTQEAQFMTKLMKDRAISIA